MADGSKKLLTGIGQWLGAFFDSDVVPAWLRWSIFIGIGVLIFWQSGWDWWFLLKVIAGILWVLLALVIFFIFLRRHLDSREE